MKQVLFISVTFLTTLIFYQNCGSDMSALLIEKETSGGSTLIHENISLNDIRIAPKWGELKGGTENCPGSGKEKDIISRLRTKIWHDQPDSEFYSCDKNGRVVDLIVPNIFGVDFDFPLVVTDLTYLKTLSLTGVKGPIPDEIGKLSELNYLRLKFAELKNSQIPSSIYDLTNLEFLFLSEEASLHLENIYSNGVLSEDIIKLAKLKALKFIRRIKAINGKS